MSKVLTEKEIEQAKVFYERLEAVEATLTSVLAKERRDAQRVVAQIAGTLMAGHVVDSASGKPVDVNQAVVLAQELVKRAQQ